MDRSNELLQRLDDDARSHGFRDAQHARESQARAVGRELREQGGTIHALMLLRDSLNDVMHYVETVAFEMDIERRGKDKSVARFDPTYGEFAPEQDR